MKKKTEARTRKEMGEARGEGAGEEGDRGEQGGGGAGEGGGGARGAEGTGGAWEHGEEGKRPLIVNVITTRLALIPPSWHLFSIYAISFLFL
jgi:hypothetical protein